MVMKPPTNAGDTASIPDQGTKIPHAVGQLSPCAATREALHSQNQKTPLSTVLIMVLSTLHSIYGKPNLNARFSLKVFLNSAFVSSCFCKKLTQTDLGPYEFITSEFCRSEVSLG